MWHQRDEFFGVSSWRTSKVGSTVRRKATAASRLKSLTVQQVTINQNSKLVHSAVAGVHALVDEHRRTDREEATWRVEDTEKREKTYADEMEEKAAKWAEEEEEWRIQQVRLILTWSSPAPHLTLI